MWWGGGSSNIKVSSLQHNKNIKRRMRGAARITEPWGAWRLNGLFLRGQLYFRISVMTSRNQRGVCQTLKSLPRGVCLCGPWGHTCKCLWDIKAVWCIRSEQSQRWQHTHTHAHTRSRTHTHTHTHTHTQNIMPFSLNNSSLGVCEVFCLMISFSTHTGHLHFQKCQ